MESLFYRGQSGRSPLIQINEALLDDVIYSLDTGHSKMFDTGAETVVRKRGVSDNDIACVPACRAPRRRVGAARR